MHILIVYNGIIPAFRYGGTQRVIWYLGKELAKMGHEVAYLTHKGVRCPFGKVYFMDTSLPVAQQIPDDTDIIHFNDGLPGGCISHPYIITMHGNVNNDLPLDSNTVFVSKNHAERFGSESFVYNGLDWDDYGQPDLHTSRHYFHFLGRAAWRVKNVRGAIRSVTALSHERLFVLGGYRLNIKMGFRLTLHPRIRFCGMVGGQKKFSLLQHSKGLIFPVRWHEPFGLALTESLYFGCPVFGTPYGSLPEIIIPDVGYLSNREEELSLAMKYAAHYSPERCHEYARDCFNAKIMAVQYLEKYEKVLNNQPLNVIPPRLQNKESEKFLAWDTSRSKKNTDNNFNS
jgi:glycosyltransferase involved in cell wall biosynthesis